MNEPGYPNIIQIQESLTKKSKTTAFFKVAQVSLMGSKNVFLAV